MNAANKQGSSSRGDHSSGSGHGSHGGGKAGDKAPAPPPSEGEGSRAQETVLRDTWAAMLEEAVGCTDLRRLAELMDAIGGMMDKVAAAGVSTKYGKKVLQKIGKVRPAAAAQPSIPSRLSLRGHYLF